MVRPAPSSVVWPVLASPAVSTRPAGPASQAVRPAAVQQPGGVTSRRSEPVRWSRPARPPEPADGPGPNQPGGPTSLVAQPVPADPPAPVARPARSARQDPSARGRRGPSGRRPVWRLVSGWLSPARSRLPAAGRPVGPVCWRAGSAEWLRRSGVGMIPGARPRPTSLDDPGRPVRGPVRRLPGRGARRCRRFVARCRSRRRAGVALIFRRAAAPPMSCRAGVLQESAPAGPVHRARNPDLDATGLPGRGAAAVPGGRDRSRRGGVPRRAAVLPRCPVAARPDAWSRPSKRAR